MLELNLLPEKEKIELKNVFRFRFAVFFSIWFFLCFILFLLILVFSSYYLKIQISNLENRFVFEKKLIQEQKIKDFEKISSQINENLSKIQEIKDRSLPIYDFLKELVLKSSKIEFQNIIFQPDLKEVSLVGFAADRDKLLNFKSGIENSFYIQSVDLPIHFLAKQKDIDFVLKIKMK